LNSEINLPKVSLLDDLDTIGQFKAEWELLWQQASHSTLFNSVEWFLTWAKSFAPPLAQTPLHFTRAYEVVPFNHAQWHPHVVVVRDQGRCVGILPLLSFKGVWRRCPARILLSPVNSQAWRSGFLLADGADWAYQAALEFLQAKADWDVLLLDGLERELGVETSVRCSAVKQKLLVAKQDFPWRNRFIRLSGDWEEYLSSKGKHFRKGLRQQEGYLAQLGEITVERHTSELSGDAGLQAFFEIDTESWKAEDGESVAATAELSQFYTRLYHGLAVSGRCEIWLLRIAGEPASAVFCIADKNIFYAYKTSFKQKFSSARLSPGLILLTHLIKQGYSAGYQEIDFLSDVPTAQRLAPTWHEYDRIGIYANHWYGRWLFTLDTVLQTVKPFIGRLRSSLKSISPQSVQTVTD